MQNKYSKMAVFAFIFALALVAVSVKAEEGSNNNANRGPGGSKPPMVNAKFKAEVEVKRENEQERKEIRQEKNDDIKDIRGLAKEELKDLKSQIPMIKREIKEGSTTEMFRKIKDQKIEILNKMKKDTFQVRKDALVKQLNIAIDNLTNIAARIAERITKAESSGRNMTTAKADLVIAQDKIVKAKAAITLLASFTPTTASSTGTTTVEVDIKKPREIGDAAIKAVKEARDALKKVVQDIAHNMGLGSKTGTSTPPISGTSTTSGGINVGTTTATTTATSTI